MEPKFIIICIGEELGVGEKTKQKTKKQKNHNFF